MTREILYRGKRVDNGEWAYGAFCPDVLEIKGKEVDWGFIRTFNKATEKMEMIEVDRKTVGQYTGLNDKNGNKIFEGDIITHTLANEQYILIWKNGEGFALDRISQLKCDDFYLSEEFCEKYALIIGNI